MCRRRDAHAVVSRPGQGSATRPQSIEFHMKNHHHNSPIHAHSAVDVAPVHEAISSRARELWVDRGRPENQDEAIWLEAEAQLVAGQHRTPGNLPLSVDS
jgi:hypothetical protein